MSILALRSMASRLYVKVPTAALALACRNGSLSQPLADPGGQPAMAHLPVTCSGQRGHLKRAGCKPDVERERGKILFKNTKYFSRNSPPHC